MKYELSDVVSKMEMQLKRFQDKRIQKYQEDLQTDTALVDKNQKIKVGAKKFNTIKKDVQALWQTLEHSYNIEMINKMEDDLKDKYNRLSLLKEEAQSVQKVEKDQKGALENLNRNKENSAKMSNLS